MIPNSPLVLIINDGWGVAPAARSNAITSANTPWFDFLLKTYTTFTLQASGESVGLPWGEMGNSEVGHLSLGSGRIMYQNLPRITRAVADDSFFSNPAFLEVFKKVGTEGTLHIAGLVSDGGVHSHIEHLYALLEAAGMHTVKHISLHCFLDGRDVPQKSALGYIEDLEKKITELKLPARIATISGRYFAMDRDNRQERTDAAYRAMKDARSEETYTHAKEALQEFYTRELYDEHIPPTVIGEPVPMKKGDGVIFFNFRPDRIRQITKKFVCVDTDIPVVTMTEYEIDLPVLGVAFPPEKVTTSLAKVLSDAGAVQLHIAETEKYAHVTYFFNGGREEAFTGEERILVPSPQVESYKEVPEMAARDITIRLIEALNTKKYHFVVVNFANADMVAHTGDLLATKQAVEVLDACSKDITKAVLELSGTLILTSDHGNAEVMIDPNTGEVNKEHTNNPVPCIIVGEAFRTKVPAARPGGVDLANRTPRGVLADVAPTLLSIMGVAVPTEMTGRSLI